MFSGDTNRDNFISLPSGSRARVNEMETQALAAIARQEGVNLSEAIRLVIREAAQSRGLWPPIVGEKE